MTTWKTKIVSSPSSGSKEYRKVYLSLEFSVSKCNSLFSIISTDPGLLSWLSWFFLRFFLLRMSRGRVFPVLTRNFKGFPAQFITYFHHGLCNHTDPSLDLGCTLIAKNVEICNWILIDNTKHLFVRIIWIFLSSTYFVSKRPKDHFTPNRWSEVICGN